MSPVSDADTVRTRIPAAERRELVLDAAVIEFGDHGWHGARVEAIAARAGISHPYLMRISSKRNLFVDAMDRAFDRMEASFTEAVTASPEADPIVTIGEAHRRLLIEDGAVMRLHMHALAVASDDDVGAAVRDRVGRFFDRLRELTGASEDRIRTCFAVGLAYAAFVTLDLTEKDGHLNWGARLLASPDGKTPTE